MKDPVFVDGILAAQDAKIANQDVNRKSVILIITDFVDDKNKQTTEYFLTTVCEKTQFVLNFKGFKVKKENAEKLTLWGDVLKHTTENNIIIEELSIPWQRVYKIKNVTYTPKTK
jgi:hypothetical protein